MGQGKNLLLWFHVMWWVAAQKIDLSVCNFKDFMGFGSYGTAWAWMHKLRLAMVRTGRKKLSEEIEIDKTFVNGRETGNKK